jgi:hypothetical protein
MWTESFQQLSEGIGKQRSVQAGIMEVDCGFPVSTPYAMNGYDSNQQNSQGQSTSWTAAG